MPPTTPPCHFTRVRYLPLQLLHRPTCVVDDARQAAAWAQEGFYFLDCGGHAVVAGDIKDYRPDGGVSLTQCLGIALFPHAGKNSESLRRLRTSV